MTRVNVAIDPSSLTDQHLLAEYREILRVRIEPDRTTPKQIPPEFTLGKGHVKFFADKGKFISERFDRIKNELERRGVNTTLDYVEHEAEWNKSYSPVESDYEKIKARVIEMMPDKPKYYKQPISQEEAKNLLRPYNPRLTITCQIDKENDDE
jgi:deoxyribonuclease (pyrimidine dimer)